METMLFSFACRICLYLNDFLSTLNSISFILSITNLNLFYVLVILHFFSVRFLWIFPFIIFVFSKLEKGIKETSNQKQDFF